MNHYLFQWTYKDPQVRALVEAPQDRVAELKKVVEAFSGKLHDFYFALGDFDGAAILEFPDNESLDACLLTIASTGVNSDMKTTVLITPQEGKRAMVRAGSVVSGYLPPVGYSAHG
ncbi:MAG: GYD domain-containing protein [Rhodospirillales bacterium]|nr:GYD domain-containing protein [Rhodospirillales bacterium]